MTDFYTRSSETAKRLTKKYGSLHAFTHTEPGAFDPGTGTTTGDVVTNYSANAAKTTYSHFERSDSSVQVGDIRLIAENANFQINDTVTVDSKQYKIISADPINPGDSKVSWEVQLRK